MTPEIQLPDPYFGPQTTDEIVDRLQEYAKCGLAANARKVHFARDWANKLRAELQRLQSAASEDVESLVHDVAMAAWDAGCGSGVVWCPKRDKPCMYHDDGLQCSPAPVAGGVLTEEDLYNACEWTGGTGDFGEYPELIRGATVENLNRILASRLPALKTGEVAVSNERLAILEECADTLSDHVHARNMTGWERRARVCVNCIDTLRSRPTTDTEREG